MSSTCVAGRVLGGAQRVSFLLHATVLKEVAKRYSQPGRREMIDVDCCVGIKNVRAREV